MKGSGNYGNTYPPVRNTAGRLTAVIAALIFFSCFSNAVKAQDLAPGWKHWMFFNFGLKVHKKVKFTAGNMISLNPDPYRFSFSSHSFNQSYRLSKPVELVSGYSATYFPRGNEGRHVFHRLQLGAAFRHKIAGIRVKHKIRAQYYLPVVQKYTVRVVYQFKVYWYNKWMPMRGRPYMAHNLFYYIGGRPLVYYDPEGAIAAYQSPTGLHRYRISFGYAFKPIKNLSVTLFYNQQWEFNTGLFDNRGLNVIKPGDPDVRLPFNNYWNYGATFSYSLSTYKKKKRKKK